MSSNIKSATRRWIITVVASAGIVASAGTADAAMNVRIVNTDGIGVASRSAPSIGARNGFGAPEGAVVSLRCHGWGDPVGARSNRLWDLVDYQGRSFWVADIYTNSPTVANVPVRGIPMCNAPAPAPAPAASVNNGAAAWAQARIGQSYASGADHSLLARFGNDGGWAPGPYGEWSGDCMRFAAAAWMSTGKRPLGGASARAVFLAYQSRGKIRGGTPPRGAIVFYDWGSYGHAGVSLGGGQVVSTQGVDGARSPVRQHGVTAISLTYRGWANPYEA